MTLAATIDAGGSGVKLGVVCLETWRVLATVRREYTPLVRAPGLYEWEPDRWWAVIESGLAEAVAEVGAPPSQYAGLTCTGMRIPFVLVDARCAPLGPGVLAPDARGRGYVAEVRSMIGSSALYATTGHWSAPHFGLPKLVWFAREQPSLWARTRWVLQFCDWLLERLCGAVLSEPSSASMSQLLDVSHREWAQGMLEAAGIDSARLPPLADAGSLAGGLRPAVAKRVGLLAGTPVHVGGGDTHVSSVGAVGSRDDVIVIVSGTTTPIMMTTRVPALDATVTPLVSAHLRPGRWAAETNVSISGAMLGWLRDLTRLDYPVLEELAEASPLGARGVLVAAANPEWGESDWAHVPPISLVGVTPGHGVGDLARAVFESTAHAVACNLARLESLNEPGVSEVALTGRGGQSPFAGQLLADVLGRRVIAPGIDNASALGGAMLVAGVDEPPTSAEGIRHERTFEPDLELHAAYAPRTRLYAETFARLRGAFLDQAAVTL